MSVECIQCGYSYVRDRMLSIDSWLDPPDNPDCVCLRCALVALKGGPEALTAEQRDEYNVKI